MVEGMNGISKEEIEGGKEEKGKAQYQKGSFWHLLTCVR